MIRAGVEKLGFKFTDIKIILGSHAHGDHMEADALVKELTGAQRDGDGAGRPGAEEDDARRQAASRSTACCTMATRSSSEVPP